MRHHRFIIDESRIQDERVTIVGAVARQMRTVLRLRVGDEIEVVSGGRRFAAQITQVASSAVTAEITGEMRACPEPAVRLTLAQALPKGPKQEWIVQKCTEIGVSDLVFFLSSRCVARLDDERAGARLTRLLRIATEAAEQSGGSRVPEIRGVVGFRDVLALIRERDSALICWEGADAPLLGNVVQNLPGIGSTLLVVGPEGGFTEDELTAAVGAGAQAVSLGGRVLRCETAAVAASAIIMHEGERRGRVARDPGGA